VTGVRSRTYLSGFAHALGSLKKSSLTYRAIRHIENGTRRRPRLATRCQLADALELGPDDRALLEHAISQAGLYLPSAVPLIGRAQEIAQLACLVRRKILVTITGAPGVGKTSLALEFANSSLDGYRGGVTFVPLDSLTDASFVLAMIARSLGIPEHDREAVLKEIVVERLQGKPTLLVLDNIEHVLEAGPTIAALMKAAPSLAVLATGRSPFRLSMEHEYALAPLALEGASPGVRPRQGGAAPRANAAKR
jgi:transcriptional regulator with XRE-family HTH domain